MFYADYHVHTSFSSDSDAPMEKIVEHAIKIGLKELAFTDHVDYDYADPELTFMIDYDKYMDAFSKVEKKYGDKINLLLGVEIGLQTHIKQKVSDLERKYPFDFIIGSIHTADRLDLYNGDFFEGKTQKISYLRYFENLLENIKLFDEFDVVGHLDYIIRYGNFETKKLSYYDYTDIIDTILKILIKKDKGIELNTSGYRYNLNQTHPQKSILKRYKELGGNIITVGSDSHTVKGLCSHFDYAYSILNEVGFDSITTYSKRNCNFYKI